MTTATKRPLGISPDFITKLQHKIDSGIGVIWLQQAGDEHRAEQIVEALRDHMVSLDNQEMDVLHWDMAHGASWNNDASDPTKLIPEVKRLDGRNLIILRDFHTILNGNEVGNLIIRRQLIEACKHNQLIQSSASRVLVILGGRTNPHADLGEHVSVVKLDLPDQKQMRHIVVDYLLDAAIETAKQYGQSTDRLQCPEEQRDRLAESLLGLSATEASRIFSEAVTACGGISEKCFTLISDEKETAIGRLPGLSFIPYRKIRDPRELGNFDNLLNFLQQRKLCYLPQAAALGVPMPKGVALVGPPGTGKTTVAQMAARILGLDLMVLKVSELFEGVVGSTESNVASALAALRALDKCVLMVDEAEKIFAHAHETQRNDGGVSSRMFAELLSFMSDRHGEAGHNVFVILTLNRTEGLAAEFLRAGRMDRIFSTSLPDAAGRQQIFSVLCRNAGLPEIDWSTTLSTATNDFSGAELEEMLNAARVATFSQVVQSKSIDDLQAADLVPSVEQLLIATQSITATGKLDAANVSTIQEFCKKVGAVPVALTETEKSRSRNIRTRASLN